MHLGRHDESARNSARFIAASAVRYREEGPLQGGRSEAPGSQSGCAHQAAERWVVSFRIENWKKISKARFFFFFSARKRAKERSVCRISIRFILFTRLQLYYRVTSPSRPLSPPRSLFFWHACSRSISAFSALVADFERNSSRTRVIPSRPSIGVRRYYISPRSVFRRGRRKEGKLHTPDEIPTRI